MSPTVRITGWRTGLKKVSMTKAIQRSSALSLTESKSCTDRVLGGKIVEISASDGQVARELVQELRRIGAVAHVLDDPATTTHAITVEETVASAEAILPGHAAPDREVDDRWQAIIAVAEFIETEPEAVWSFARKWGAHRDDDLRMAIATCVLEHLLEHHFDAFFSRVEEAAKADRRFAKTVTYCGKFGQSQEPVRSERFGQLVASILATSPTRKQG